MYNKLSASQYEVHTAADKTLWGKTTPFARESLDILFTETDATSVYTLVPADNTLAYKLAKRCGFKELYKTSHRFGENASVLYIDLQTWARRASSFKELGEKFHHAIENTGLDTDHDDDPVHDKYVGIALRMHLAGNTSKAEWFFNTWGAMAGFAPVHAHADGTLTIGVGTEFEKQVVIKE